LDDPAAPSTPDTPAVPAEDPSILKSLAARLRLQQNWTDEVREIAESLAALASPQAAELLVAILNDPELMFSRYGGYGFAPGCPPERSAAPCVGALVAGIGAPAIPFLIAAIKSHFEGNYSRDISIRWLMVGQLAETLVNVMRKASPNASDEHLRVTCALADRWTKSVREDVTIGDMDCTQTRHYEVTFAYLKFLARIELLRREQSDRAPSPGQPDACANCGRQIGPRAQAWVSENQIVCQRCWAALKEEQARTWTTS
jgi:hypothetical protein